MLLKKPFSPSAVGGQFYPYPISNSMMLDSNANYLTSTPAGAADSAVLFTSSGWLKPNAFGIYNLLFGSDLGTDAAMWIGIDNNDRLTYKNRNSSGSTTSRLESTMLLRDPAAHYHIVFLWDTAQGTSTDRVRIWLNGVEVLDFSTTKYPSLNDMPHGDAWWTAAAPSLVGGGKIATGASYYGNEYISDVHHIDGQSKLPTDFGEFNSDGVWVPIEYAGTYGTNGFHLPFNDTNLGYDSVSDSDLFTEVGTPTQETDTPTDNQCVLNVLNASSGVTIFNGNRTVVHNGASTWRSAAATFGVSAGKWYWECLVTDAAPFVMVGIAYDYFSAMPDITYAGVTQNSWGYNASDGDLYNNGVAAAYGASYSDGDYIGVEIDLDSGTLEFYKNNVSQGVAVSGLPVGIYYPVVSVYSTGQGRIDCAFDSEFWQYIPQAGFDELSANNIRDTHAIAKPSDHFAPEIYTGNGATLSVDTLDFQPDLTLLKNRDETFSYGVFDAIREATNFLSTDSDAIEATSLSSLSSFDPNGFTVGADIAFNRAGGRIASWNWKGGGTGIVNNDGTAQSIVSANVAAGFSVVSWDVGVSSDTVGHGLGAKPYIIIQKPVDTVLGWPVYDQHNGAGKYMLFNTTNDPIPSAGVFTNAPNASVFTPGSGFTSALYNEMTAWVFAPIQGLSSMGVYQANGVIDGPFINCGMRPAFIIIKLISGPGGSWFIWDTKRNTFNPATKVLFPYSTSAEIDSALYLIDIASNGFKIRTTEAQINAPGHSYLYMAFAEHNDLSLAR